jgi:eukaryotic-like serine/threonine-protein kinase
VNLPDQLHTALAGRYRVERELGAGGMATVYLARDVKHDRDVAIKVLHPDLAAALGGDRFLSEIKTTAKLQHPHILPLLDSGEADGLLYYVMPYVSGETLRTRLQRERQLPIHDALRIAREVADALGAAHAQGIIHRDIKPENILLQGDHALVADFGIALAVQTAGGARMTQTGLSLGTPQYMSPEQAMGEKTIDARADIYALGAVTYEMLVGEPPFTGPSVQAIVGRIMSEDPRGIVIQRKAVSDQVEYAVLHALEKLPADRFATAHEFVEALSPSASTGSSTTSPAPRTTRVDRATRRVGPGMPGRKTLVPLLVGALLVGGLLAGSAAWTAASHRGDNRSVSFTIDAPASGGVRQPTSDVRISPDGGTFAFIVQSDTTTKLYVRSLGEVDPHPLSEATGAGTYAFAPDEKRLAVIGFDGKLRIVPLDGGRSVTLATVARFWSGVAWADNTTLVVGGQPSADGLSLMSTTGGAPRQVFKPHPNTIHGYPFVAEDGETVFFLDWGPGFTEDDYLAMGSLKTGKFETSKLLAQGIAGVVDGRVLYTTAGGALMAARFDRRSNTISSDAERVIDGLTNINNPTASLSLSGTLMYERGQPTARLVLADSAGLDPLSSDDRTLLAPQPYNGTVRYSPDGRRIAVNVIEQRADTTSSNIWTFDVATRTFSPLTTRGDVIAPEWTPDGRRLVFISWFERNPGIWWQSADGSDSAESLVKVPNGESVFAASVTPDGRGIVYCKGSFTTTDAYYLPFAGRVPEKLLGIDEGLGYGCAPRVSLDGRWLAYVVERGSQPQVYVRPFRSPGGRIRISTDGGDFPVWSRDGKRLYYRSAGGSLAVVTVQTNGALLTVTKREHMPGTHAITIYDVAPDGRRVLTAQPSDVKKQIVVTTNWLSMLRTQRSAGR